MRVMMYPMSEMVSRAVNASCYGVSANFNKRVETGMCRRRCSTAVWLNTWI